jgi:NAD(P)-dependent dehydrogenase (short-subunit alcohol dehydrogenase family)
MQIEQKVVFVTGRASGLGEASALRAQARTHVMQTADAQEGPRAFAEKREPTWTGH